MVRSDCGLLVATHRHRRVTPDGFAVIHEAVDDRPPARARLERRARVGRGARQGQRKLCLYCQRITGESRFSERLTGPRSTRRLARCCRRPAGFRRVASGRFQRHARRHQVRGRSARCAHCHSVGLARIGPAGRSHRRTATRCSHASVSPAQTGRYRDCRQAGNQRVRSRRGGS